MFRSARAEVERVSPGSLTAHSGLKGGRPESDEESDGHSDRDADRYQVEALSKNGFEHVPRSSPQGQEDT